MENGFDVLFMDGSFCCMGVLRAFESSFSLVGPKF